jgi:hypothetical protein
VQYDLIVSPLFANYHLQFNNHGANCGHRTAAYRSHRSASRATSPQRRY